MARKLTPKDYEDVRQMYYDGESMGNIAKKKAISKWHVESIINGSKGDKPSGLYVIKKNEPLGGLTPEMIAETASRVHIGSCIIVPIEIEEGGYLVKKTKMCRVTGTYRHIFTYQNGQTTGSYRYSDILTGDVKVC